VFVRDPESGRTRPLDTSEHFGLINRSRHNANFKIFYKIPSWQADVNMRVLYRSRFGLFETNGNGVLDDFDQGFVDGFATVNLTASKTFYEDFTLRAGAVNLLNTRRDFQPNMPGIQGFIQLNYNF
jgi:outer membrane receptor for ferrienterochelin and colicins